MERKEKLRTLIEKSGLPDVICGKYVEERGVDLFKAVCQHNLEGVVAKRKTGTYANPAIDCTSKKGVQEVNTLSRPST